MPKLHFDQYLIRCNSQYVAQLYLVKHRHAILEVFKYHLLIFDMQYAGPNKAMHIIHVNASNIEILGTQRGA